MGVFKKQVSRREFFKFAATGSAVVVVSPSLLLLTGCPKVTQSQLAQLVAEAGTGLESILPYIKGVAPDVADAIEKSFQALESTVQSWKTGDAIAIVEQVVNAFVANMALLTPFLPVLAVYQPLIALIVATVEGIITLLVPNAPQPATAAARGLVIDARAAWPKPPQTAAQFRSKWNSVVKADPLLKKLAIA